MSERILQARPPADVGLARNAYTTILGRIVRGDYAIGQLISRRTVAKDLGISFLPASEALLRLENEGFVESRPRAGTRIRIPGRMDAEGHFLVTEALEVQAALMFAANSTASERAELIRLALRLDAAAVKETTDPLDYVALHEKLHVGIAECGRCDALCDAIRRQSSLMSAWLCAMRAVIHGNERPKHEPLIRALSRQKPAAAAETMRTHLRTEAEQVLRSLEPHFELNGKYLLTYSRSVANKTLRTGNIPQTVPAMDAKAL